MNYINSPLCRYHEACLLSLSPFSMILFPLAYCPVSNIPTFHMVDRNYPVVSIIPAKLRCIGIADAEICHSGDIFKIFRSRHCVRDTVLSLQVLKVYTYKPAKNFVLKNHLLNSLSCVRTLVYKTVQISANRISIHLVFQTKKECRLIPFGFLHSSNLLIGDMF